MSFDRNNENIENEKQLNLFTQGVAGLDFIPDFKIPAPRPPEANKSPRFMTLSVTLHIAAAVCMAVLSVPLVNELKTETITIELEEPVVHQATKGSDVEPTQGGAPAPAAPAAPVAPATLPEKLPAKVAQSAPAAPVQSAPAATQKAVVAAPVVAEDVSLPEPVDDLFPPPAPAKPAAAAQTAKAAPAKTTFKAVPMSIDDINSPELDAAEVANQKSDGNIGEDLNKDFDEIDNKSANNIANEEAEMNAMASALKADHDNEMQSLEEQNKAQAAALAESQKNLRQKNAKAVASAMASERAAADAAAREKAAKEAAALAAANSAINGNGAGGEGTGKGEKAGAGAGNNGLEKAGDEIAGAPTGVRSLDQLKQMPGNQRPQYSEDERLQGHQGKVSFEAYITKDGVPVQFKMKQSTGYRNLDKKTLAALKTWRFYPGQEGWVEMPFSWDLKGGVQEVKGRLRTAVGQL
ncbi:energy transducer TonB [Bdellovibrio sp. HCB274]|uniref:energy transducer TonB n=1 Tax=Bdellovibrio sp. HCB274 TaxID=3394361 RepID=UPI0039B64183